MNSFPFADVERAGRPFFDADEPIKTALIGGFVLSLGIFLSLILVVGYLVRILRSPPDRGLPPFGDWGRLLVDGALGLLIWLLYALAPLAAIVLWMESFYVTTDGFASPPRAEWIADAVVLSIGAAIGGGFSAYDLLQMAWDGVFAANLGAVIAPPYGNVGAELATPVLSAAVGASLLATTYAFPAALARFARTGSLRSAFDRELTRELLRGRYAAGWLFAATLWFLGAALQVSWNLWRTTGWRANEESDFALESVGAIPVVVRPEPVGLQSTPFLLVVSVVSFVFLAYGYAVIARVTREAATSEAP